CRRCAGWVYPRTMTRWRISGSWSLRRPSRSLSGAVRPHPPTSSARAWVRPPESRAAVANRWFLATETPEPIAFVGFETSPPDRIGEGGAADPSRTWAGFVTDDPRLVGAIAGYLQAVSDREAPPAPDGH